MADEPETMEAEALPRGAGVRYGEINPLDTAKLKAAASAAGNIQMQEADETMALPQASSEQLLKQQELVRQVELRRRMKLTVVPTDPAEVRQLLRQLQQPVTLFGEREMERRERLRKLLATMGEEELAQIQLPDLVGPAEAAPLPSELFYTEGAEELKQARLQIAAFSLPQAARRLAAARLEAEDSAADRVAAVDATVEKLRELTNQISEIGDERPIAALAFSPDGTALATGAWSGALKLWSAPGCQKQLTVKAHAERITGLAWHPAASTSGRAAEAAPLLLATGATDRVAKLWGAGGALLRTLEGHGDRLGRLAFHPMGRHLGTASFDRTWRLWDVETGACLLEQEGHSRAVYTVAFQRDGALAVSGGMDAVGRLWDLRSGRCILLLEGHIKPLLAADFSPNGYVVATGSEDHSARVFDLRRKGPLATLPGHTSLVSQVRFEPDAGSYLITSGYDNVTKLWAAGRKYELCKTLAGHEGKVMASDVSPGGSFLVATAGYDRTLKLWAP